MIEDSWDFGWHVKKFFSELYGIGDNRNFLITKKIWRGMEDMWKVYMEDEG